MKRLPKYYIDNKDLIGKYLPNENRIDGGDTAHRMGLFYFGILILYYIFGKDAAEDFLNKLGIPSIMRPNHYGMTLLYLMKSGVIVRHPDPRYWYSETNRGSRDQSSPNLASMVAYSKLAEVEANSIHNRDKVRMHLREFYKSHKKRAFLFTTNTRRNGATPENHGIAKHGSSVKLKWYHKLIIKLHIPLLPIPDDYKNYNWKLPDLTGPNIWSMYVRAYGKDNFWTKALLTILDLELLINALIKRKKKEDTDVGNHVVSSLLAGIVKPTIVSKYVNNKLNSYSDLSNRLKDYFNDSREPWFIYDIYEPLMMHYFKGD